MYSIQTTCSEKILKRCKKCLEIDVEVCPSRKGCTYYNLAEIMKIIEEEKTYNSNLSGDNL